MEKNNYFAPKLSLSAKILATLNILLALFIIFFSSRLLETEFGKTSLIFGILMFLITTTLRILQKW